MGLRDDLAAMRHYSEQGRLDDYMAGRTGPRRDPKTGEVIRDPRDFDPHRDGIGPDDTSPHAKPSTNWGAIKARGLGD